MKNLYFIIGADNVSAFEQKEYDDINLMSVYHRTFSNTQEKEAFINGMLMMDGHQRNGTGEYILLSENEYKNLTT
tara:strand:+ start:142 stop:366 length:225 start_codon:yes stop_codon:yes gene_type:complete